MKRLAVVAAVLVQDGKILLAKRGASSQLEGYWEFPGGKIQALEDPITALKREIKEELDLTIKVNKFITTSEYDYPFAKINLSTYLCQVEPNQLPKLKEHTEIRWLTPASAAELKISPADLATMQILLKMDLTQIP